MTEKKTENCPHCNQAMKKWAPPPDSTWGRHWQWVCFNDECPYYEGGWKHMMQNFQVRASYRFKFDPLTGDKGPLPTWSSHAHRSSIVPDDDE